MGLLKHSGFWKPRVLTCSALHNQSIDTVWETICEYRDAAIERGALESKRASQNLSWMRQLVNELLLRSLRTHPGVREALPAIEKRVQNAEVTPLAAALEVIERARS
ncbi:LAO/AO transport system ATPase [Luminiphilus syltensis NOR5-1B]|uniref:LAO/AO transport system ATPase n=1 Tax=Luminiphilus syltensis NOR5-1B TaxID=565045 RepID=B8KRM6_9GAMM|nr:LAO/AO transport system ATPase [Luminiphilus syltensis NOR5-1B]